MTFLGCLMSTRLRLLMSVALIISCVLMASRGHAAPEYLADLKLGPETLGDPERFVDLLGLYATFSEPEMADGVGNIIGHMAGMFRHFPDQIDSWLEKIDHPRLETFAVIALGLADHQDVALTFAEARQVDVSRIASILTYLLGDEFPNYASGDVEGSIKQWLVSNGTLEEMPQNAPWRQDVIWSFIYVAKDGQLVVPILEKMDSLAKSLDVPPSTTPLRRRLEDQEFADKFNQIKQERGNEAFEETLLEYVYIASGGWSIAAHGNLPHVAEAVQQYFNEHPESFAVREALSYAN